MELDPFTAALASSLSNQRNLALDNLAMLDATLTVERAESAKLRERIAELEAAGKGPT